MSLIPATAQTPIALPARTGTALNVLDQAKRINLRRFPNYNEESETAPTTIPNVQYLLASYGITVRYNVIKKKLVLTMPGHSGSPDNFDNTALTQICSLAMLNGMNTGPIGATVEAIGDRNLFNPVTDWITSKPWDGRNRLPEMYATLTERDDYPTTLKETLIYRWMLSGVAAAFEKTGFSCRGVLTLQGAQGMGKTKWTSALVSDAALRKQVVKLGHHLDAGDKDSQLAAITHWLVEIGELDGSLKRDIARLKGFLTLDMDKIRRPYARTESEYARKTVFCATVNDDKFLVDPTGNTRFWTIAVTGIDYQHSVDMQQVWAQLAFDYQAGAQWWLTADEERMLEEQNRLHRSESVIRERLLGALDLTRIGEPGLPAKTSIEVLKLIGEDRPTNPMMKECCGALRELLGPSKRIRGLEKWRVPLCDLTSPGLDDELMSSPATRPGFSMEDDIPF